MATADGLAANLRLLRPIRVLLVTRDRRFAGLARLLLSRDEMLVDWTPRSGEALDCVRDGADVVVVDASGAAADAAVLAAELEASFPDVGVLVVSEQRGPGHGRRLLSKWGSLEELGREIQRAYLGLGRRQRVRP